MRTRRFARYAAPLAAVPLLFGCGIEEEPSTPQTGTFEPADIYTTGNVVEIHPGESRFTNVMTSEEAQDIINDIPNTDHQYPHGWYDDRAPTVGQLPVRLDAHVALSGAKSNYLDNDAACDTIRLDLYNLNVDAAYIGAVAISDGTDDQVQINWPLEADGSPSDHAQLCMDQGAEPEFGVVLFVSDAGR